MTNSYHAILLNAIVIAFLCSGFGHERHWTVDSVYAESLNGSHVYCLVVHTSLSLTHAHKCMDIANWVSDGILPLTCPIYGFIAGTPRKHRYLIKLRQS